MKIQGLLIIITVFLVFASFTTAESCCDIGNACIISESCITDGYTIVGDAIDGTCDGLPGCQVGCCNAQLLTLNQCDIDMESFDSTITGEAACTNPAGFACCNLNSVMAWESNLACFNSGGVGSELVEEECETEIITYYNISGTVLDETNIPVSTNNIIITSGIETFATSVDADGTYLWNQALNETTYFLNVEFQNCAASESVTIQGSDVEVNLTLDCEVLTCSELALQQAYSDYICCSFGDEGILDGILGTGPLDACPDPQELCWINANACQEIIFEEGDSCLSTDATLNLTGEAKSQSVVLAWESEECTNGLYDVFKCITQDEDCNPFGGATTLLTTDSMVGTTLTDNNIIQEARTYCYGVVGYYNFDGTTNQLYSNIVCLPFDEIQCDTPGDSSCVDANTYELCTETFQLEQEDCEIPENLCVDDYENNVHECVKQAECNLCNGPLGVFLNENIEVEYISCWNLDTCFIDYAPIVVDNYRECLNINSCYDYRSRDACEGEQGMDTCSKGPCQWMETSTEELGIGVCRPIQAIKQDCSKCEDMTFNEFFGICNAERCSWMGSCYFDDDLSDDQCKDMDLVSCSHFNDRESCIDSANSLSLEGITRLNQSVLVSVSYNHTETGELLRIAGTHTILNDSDSHFGILPGFNLCRWFNDNSCGKDANGDYIRDSGNPLDMVPPVTNLLILGENPILPKELNIGIVITDNKATSGLKTYFSYTKEQQYQEDDNASQEYYYDYVYPMIEVTNNLITTEEINESGKYRIYYYSEDPSNNLEIVNSIDVTVDVELIMPIVAWSFVTTSSDNSTLLINLEVHEKVWCSAGLYADNAGAFGDLIIQNLNLNELEIGNYTLTMESADGSYYYLLECQDTVQNMGEVTTAIGVNAPVPYLVEIE